MPVNAMQIMDQPCMSKIRISILCKQRAPKVRGIHCMFHCQAITAEHIQLYHRRFLIEQFKMFCLFKLIYLQAGTQKKPKWVINAMPTYSRSLHALVIRL